jgi:hypothetical protein
MCLLMFTGRVKNTVEHGPHFHDEAGWGFSLSIASLIMSVVALTLLAVFRLPPTRAQHKV